MKKLVGVIAAFMLFASLFSGCGPNAQSSTNTPDNPDNAATNQGAPPEQTGSGDKAKFTPADLSGEVSSISGNNVTLKVIETPNFRNGGGPNGKPNRDRQNKDNSGSHQGDGQDAPKQNPNGNGDSKQGSGGNGQKQDPGPRAMKFTGENKTVEIPAGTPITTFVRGQNGRENKNIDIKDIKQGDMLQIWYSDKDKGTISKISVMSPQKRQGDPNNQDTQNNKDNQTK